VIACQDELIYSATACAALLKMDFLEILKSNRSPAFTPLRFAKITLTGIGPSAPVAIEDFAKFVEHFRSDPQAPAGESFAGGSCRAFFFPSSAHRGNFQQVRMCFCFGHGRIVTSNP
jgi:hypothetical protein